MFEASTQEAEMLTELGYRPMWVEDLQEGDDVAYMELMSLRDTEALGLSYPQREFVRFATVTDLRRSAQPTYDQDGVVVATHTILRCFMEIDNGRLIPWTRGAGHHIWRKTTP